MNSKTCTVPALALFLPLTGFAQTQVSDRDAIEIAPGERVVGMRLFADLHELRPESERIVSDVVFGDLDGDGDLDAFYANGIDFYAPYLEPNALQLNDGTGRFRGADFRLPLDAQITAAARLDDLEGDGDLDLITLDPALGVRTYLNDGEARFAEAPAVLSFLADFDFELGDIDGDGDLDLLVFSEGQDQLFVNDGTPHFAEESFRLPADDQPTGFASFGDVNGDDQLDLLVGGGSALASRLYLNEGSGVFGHAFGSLPKDDPHSLQLVDVDGDDDLDAFSGRALYLNDGAGFFQDASHQLPANPFFDYVMLMDLEGDGDVDALLSRLLYVNDGNGKFTDERDRLPEVGAWSPRTVGDVDGDGDADVLSASWTVDIGFRIVHRDSLFLGDGTGDFLDTDSETQEIPLRPDAHRGAASCSALVDMDGDGDLDAITGASIDDPGGSREQKTFLFTNDGYGQFGDRSELFPHIDGLVQDLDVADFDLDGDMDVLRAERANHDGGGGGLQFHWNHGPDGFDTTYGPFVAPDSSALDVGDVDHDGDVDILAGSSHPATALVDRLFLNDGAGGFENAVDFPGGDHIAEDVRLVDVNGDEHLDAVLIGTRAFLFLNDGSASFTDASSTLPFSSGLAMDWADVDMDGDADLLLLRRPSFSLDDEVTLFLNDGDGLFQAAPQDFSTGARRLEAVKLHDVNADGYPDAFVDGHFFRNDGSGAFRFEADALPPYFSVAGGSFADVDGDGDVDLLSAGRLWTNLTRQVSWGTLPRIGQPLEMKIHGPAQARFVLAFAPNPAVLAGARRGVLLYDPSLLRVVETGRLRADGTARVVTDVPDDPALVGAGLFWQALVGNHGHLTNVEWTTLLGF